MAIESSCNNITEAVDSELMSGEKLSHWNKTELVLMKAHGLQRIDSRNTRYAENGSLTNWGTEKCGTIRNANPTVILYFFY